MRSTRYIKSKMLNAQKVTSPWRVTPRLAACHILSRVDQTEEVKDRCMHAKSGFIAADKEISISHNTRATERSYQVFLFNRSKLGP